MGLITIQQIRNITEGIFGRGKDQYTQTRFSNIQRNFLLLKGEEWVNVDDGNLFHLYQSTAQLRTVIERKAWMIANGKWKHYKIENGEKVLQERSEIVGILNNPNPLQNGKEFLADQSITQSIYGNVLIFGNKAMPTSIPRKIWSLPGEGMVVKRNKNLKLFKQVDINSIVESYKVYYDDNSTETFTPDQLIHFRDPNPNDPVIGLSKVQALMMPISNVRGAMGFRNRIITSNAMLGILSPKVAAGSMYSHDLEEQNRINEGFGKKWGMQQGKGDIMQSENPLEWSAMSYPTKDLMLFEEVDNDFKQIIDAFGLNANLFSFNDQATYENMEHGMRLAYRDTIIPEGMQRAFEYTKFFGLDGVNEWLELDYSHLDVLQEDHSTQNKDNAEALSKLILAGVSPEAILEITGIDVGELNQPNQEQS